jgi:hypothetical protein
VELMKSQIQQAWKAQRMSSLQTGQAQVQEQA